MSRDRRAPCPTGNEAPIIDTSVAAGFLVTTAYFAVNPCREGDAGETCNAVRPVAILVTLLPGLIYAGAAVQGFGNTAYCRDLKRR